MNRHLSSFSQVTVVGKTLIGKLLERETPPHQQSLLAVLTKHVIVVLQRRRRSHVNGFLPRAGHVKGNATLALRVLQNRVHFPESYHLAVRAQQSVGRVRVGKRVRRGLQEATGLQFGRLVGVLVCQRLLQNLKLVVSAAVLWWRTIHVGKGLWRCVIVLSTVPRGIPKLAILVLTVKLFNNIICKRGAGLQVKNSKKRSQYIRLLFWQLTMSRNTGQIPRGVSSCGLMISSTEVMGITASPVYVRCVGDTHSSLLAASSEESVNGVPAAPLVSVMMDCGASFSTSTTMDALF